MNFVKYFLRYITILFGTVVGAVSYKIHVRCLLSHCDAHRSLVLEALDPVEALI
jgi:hypothetical protein